MPRLAPSRRRRFLKDRCDGLLDEAQSGRSREPSTTIRLRAVIERTLRTKPTDATHWSICSMAAQTGFGRTVADIAVRPLAVGHPTVVVLASKAQR
jgi:hypothetical protein